MVVIIILYLSYMRRNHHTIVLVDTAFVTLWMWSGMEDVESSRTSPTQHPSLPATVQYAARGHFVDLSGNVGSR